MDTVASATPVTTPAGPAAAPAPDVIRVDQEQVRGHLDRLVRQSVEEILNALLDA